MVTSGKIHLSGTPCSSVNVQPRRFTSLCVGLYSSIQSEYSPYLSTKDDSLTTINSLIRIVLLCAPSFPEEKTEKNSNKIISVLRSKLYLFINNQVNKIKRIETDQK